MQVNVLISTECHDFINISPFFYAIISEKLATLKELQEFYSIRDACDLYEVVVVGNYNKRIGELNE